MFDAKKEKEYLVNWIKEWFDKNGPESPAVIGISGGKDSTIMAALCVEALGKDRVIGVMMPQGVQKDIGDSKRVIEHLGILGITVNIGPMYEEIVHQIPFKLSRQAEMNTPPRLRMTSLYAVSQSWNGRVACTCNYSERMIGWETIWGDAVGDFAPFAQLTATQVIEIGKLCDIPHDLVVKTPSDGLCGQTDEDKFGFTYAELDDYLVNSVIGEHYDKIDKMIRGSEFKRIVAMPMYIPTGCAFRGERK